MAKIFEGQNALRFEADTNVDITGAVGTLIKYIKPDGSSGTFSASIDDAENGIIYYDVVNTTELDQEGTWIMWAHVTFSDGRVAQGVPIRVKVFAEGTLL